jgi:hypothetical protein
MRNWLQGCRELQRGGIQHLSRARDGSDLFPGAVVDIERASSSPRKQRRMIMKTMMSGLLALSFIAGIAGTAMAVENDNDRSTYSAKQFYQKHELEQGGGGN